MDYSFSQCCNIKLVDMDRSRLEGTTKRIFFYTLDHSNLGHLLVEVQKVVAKDIARREWTGREQFMAFARMNP